jgi:hypothetical protein
MEYKNEQEKLERELHDFTKKIQQMVWNLEPENIEFLDVSGFLESLESTTADVKKYYK